MLQDVYTLLCQRDMPMARITLPTMLRALSPGQLLFVFDDGSFTQESVQELCRLSANVRVVTKAEREEQVQGLLSGKKNCIAYREKFPFAFKLLDIPLLVAGKEQTRYTYTDADIIYLKNCGAYFTCNNNTYLRTDGVKLSIRLKDVFFKYRWKIPYKFNAGYFSFDTLDYDLDFIDYYLGLPEVHNNTWLSEQTCWALLFERSGKQLVCPAEEQFVCREDFSGPVAQTLAIHLISNLKKRCAEWAEYGSPLEPCNHVRFEPSRNVNMLDWVKKTGKGILHKL